MPRIIVTTDSSHLLDDAPVLLDEQVHSVHLSSGHAAAQLVQRLAWAVRDAEGAEGAREAQRARAVQQSPPLPLPAQSGVHAAVGA
jgi:hypothetical protein